MLGHAVKSKAKEADKSPKPPQPSTAPMTGTGGFDGLFLRRKASCACGGGCSSCQAKSGDLKVSHANDAEEIEADQIADKVMRMPGPQLNGRAVFSSVPNAKSAASGAGISRFARDGAGHHGHSGSILTGLDPGRPLDAETRAFFEPRFGADFGHVRVHTDAQAAGSARFINALAFTAGRDVVFDEGQYQPGTDKGKNLLAHELTHVVRQTSSTPKIQRRERDPAERKKIIDDCLKSTDDILPGHVGVVTHIDRAMMLEEMFGAELPGIVAKIRADTAARRFVCEYGVSGMAALVETQQGGSFDVPAAKTAVDDSTKAKTGRFNRAKMENWRVSEQRQEDVKEEAQSVGSWAKAEDMAKDDIPSPSAALNMPAAQVTDITSMIDNLELLKTNYSSFGTSFTDIQKSLTRINKLYTDATPSMMTESYGAEVRSLMDEVIKEIDLIRPLLFRISAGRMKLDNLTTGLSNIQAATDSVKDKARVELRKSLNGDSPDYSDMKTLIRETRTNDLKTFRDDFNDTKKKIESIEKSLPKLLFVMHYFRALNDPKKSAPTEADMNTFNGHLDDIEATLFFGEGPANAGLDIMESVIVFVKQQVAVRLEMKAATGNLPALIPSLAEVESYFTTMNSKDITNDTVRQAYEGFADAYFQHRGELSMDDLKISGISDVFSLPTSITGTRSIVCGAYAQMGAALMKRAGATKLEFTIAVRASVEQIQNNTIDDGHAIVKVTRQSGTFFISNDSTENTEAEAMNVAWDNPALPMHKATASNYNDAVRKLEKQLAKLLNP